MTVYINGMSFSLKKDVLTRATTWMDLEGIMLSDISQSQKDRSCRIPMRSLEESGSHRQKVGWGCGMGWVRGWGVSI